MGVLEQLQEVIFLISSWRARHAHVRWHVHTSHICHHEPRCRTRMVHGYAVSTKIRYDMITVMCRHDVQGFCEMMVICLLLFYGIFGF